MKMLITDSYYDQIHVVANVGNLKNVLHTYPSCYVDCSGMLLSANSNQS